MLKILNYIWKTKVARLYEKPSNGNGALRLRNLQVIYPSIHFLLIEWYTYMAG